MSRAQPPIPHTDEEQLRVDVATQLRRGLHLFVGGDHSVEQLAGLSELLRTTFDELEGAPVRVKDPGKWKSPEVIRPPAEGEEFDNAIDRPVSGHGNPWSIPLTVVREGDRAVARVNLGLGFEGAPTRSHGGVVSAIYDDLCGFLLVLEEELAFTAYITVTYLHGTPLGEELVFSTWKNRREGRKLFLEGECTFDGEVITRCEALFVTVAPVPS